MGKKKPNLCSKTRAGSREGKCQGGGGGCSGRALPASLLGTRRGPCSSFPRLPCLRSQGLLCHAAVTPRTAVCTTNPGASFVEAFNDSGAGSSPGDGSHCLQNSSLSGCLYRNPQGAELMLAPLPGYLVLALFPIQSSSSSRAELRGGSSRDGKALGDSEGNDLGYTSQAWLGSFQQGWAPV